MRLLQFIDPAVGRCVARLDGDVVVDLTSLNPDVTSIYDLLYARGGVDQGLDASVRELEHTHRQPRRLPAGELFANAATSLPRLDRPLTGPAGDSRSVRFWLAGVTHLDSARVREAEARRAVGQTLNVYDRKYDESLRGGRPELFPKHDPDSVVGPGVPILRPSDTVRLVPEAELVSVYGRSTSGHVALLGYTGGNDVTDNGLEALNPLNLPQAKNWSGGCASLGPILVTPDEFDPGHVDVSCEVWRRRKRIARKEGATGTDHLNLRDGPSQMERYLFARFPLEQGQVQALYWGTPLVFEEVDLADGLLPGDVVRVYFGQGIGLLENPVSALHVDERAAVGNSPPGDQSTGAERCRDRRRKEMSCR